MEENTVTETTQPSLARKGVILFGAAVGILIATGLTLPKLRRLSNSDSEVELSDSLTPEGTDNL